MSDWKKIHLDDPSMWPEDVIVEIEDSHDDARGSIQPLYDLPTKSVVLTILPRRGRYAPIIITSPIGTIAMLPRVKSTITIVLTARKRHPRSNRKGREIVFHAPNDRPCHGIR